MKRLSLLLILIGLINCTYSQKVLLNDQFSDRSKFHDLSLGLIWGSNTDYTSAYAIQSIADKNGLTYNALGFVDSAMVHVNYHGTDNSLKASTCFDYELQDIPTRGAGDTIKLEYDIMWSALHNSGERGRVNVILFHDYPEGGPKKGMIDSIANGHPYGRPAYFYRVRNTTFAGITNKGFIGMGGGNDPLGKMYVHVWQGDSLHWLPGAVPETGSGGSAFPSQKLSKNFTATIPKNNEWVHVTTLILDDKIRIYSRASSGNGLGNLVTELPTPKDDPFPSGYYFKYRYFDKIKAVRFYANGLNTNTYWANVKMTTTGNTVVGIKEELKNEISIYPNPIADELQVVGEVKSLTLFNQFGTQITKAVGNSVNTSLFQSGLYTLKVELTNGSIVMKKIIKQ